MKKALSIILCVLMLLCALTSCGAEKEQDKQIVTFPVDEANLDKNDITPHSVDFTAFALDDNGNVFAVSGEKILKFSLEGEFLEEYAGAEGLSTLYCDGEYVYASMNYFDLVRLDTATKEITEIAKAFCNGSIIDIAVLDGTAYVLSVNPDSAKIADTYLWRIDTDGGEPTLIPSESITAIYVTEDGSTLYAYSSDDDILYKLKGNALEKVKEFDMDINPSTFIVENGYFCYADTYNGEDQLLKINLNLDKAEPERVIPEGVYISGYLSAGSLRYQKGNVYFVDGEAKSFSSVYLEPAPKKAEEKPKESDPNSLVVGGSFFQSTIKDSVITAVAKEAGLNGEYKEFYDIYVKLLAGDSDVDIYFVTMSTIKPLVDQGIYVPINSDIVAEFNAGCFDYINEAAKDKNGQIVAMPIFDYATFVTYPVQAAEELGFTREDITYYDDFQALVDSTSERKAYLSATMTLYYSLENQYDYYYNDFANKKANYDTELFRHIYSHLDGWQRKAELAYPIPRGYSVSWELGPLSNIRQFNREKTLFNVAVEYEDILYAMVDSPLVNPGSFKFDVNDWRAIHMPWITEEVDKNVISVWFAIINPYSEHYDEAVKLLEQVAENYFDSLQRPYGEFPIIRKDISEYPERYHTETQVFKDVYEIVENGCIKTYSMPYVMNDINEFQAGRLTMDEAIDERQRQIDIWLNE